MAKNNTNLETKKGYVPTESDSSLKGTLIFTMLVGLFIVGSWSAIFYLFLNRM
ncbi:cytochrome c oxidase subunit 2A [Anaerobacillus alkaliphilus]|uniref:Cytochrome c oxidase subunit 2A n=1 Tax=Anaerobacillus alkaliphilus TaxID=1548597 RepID=A0A4Q0VVD0_9BACI|nr:cytochrome c oxidase subunit 2A [Anaerobacillus alkaliphilus]RXJ01941.1 cytochrome c oxidase subunit 2A [Anaerobacillus alkaliphilus]